MSVLGEKKQTVNAVWPLFGVLQLHLGRRGLFFEEKKTIFLRKGLEFIGYQA